MGLILAAIGAAERDTPIVAVAHDLQIWTAPLSELETEVPADTIVTPTQTLFSTPVLPRPSKIRWSLVSEKLFDEPYFASHGLT